MRLTTSKFCNSCKTKKKIFYRKTDDQNVSSPAPQASLQHPQPENIAPGMVNINVGPQRVSVRKDLRYTPAVAAQIANEASKAAARGAVAMLDHVVENLDEDSSSENRSSYDVRL